MAAGRPSEYDPKFCQLLIEHMKSGMSYETFGTTIGVSKQTLYNWEKKHPAFVDAKGQAWDESRAFWEKVGIEGLWNVPGKPTLNNTSWVFNMKNRFGWKDKSEVEVSSKPDKIKSDEDDDGVC